MDPNKNQEQNNDNPTSTTSPVLQEPFPVIPDNSKPNYSHAEGRFANALWARQFDDYASTSSATSPSPLNRTKSRRASFVDRMSTGSPGDKPDYSEEKIVVAMVGLPARGKSYLSNKLQRYLRWREYNVKVFNVGQFRRHKSDDMEKKCGKREDHSASFFDPNNAEAYAKRESFSNECLEQLIHWLKHEGGNVGIHDATNSTRSRRTKILERVKREPGLKVIFLESVCTDQDVIKANIALKASSGDPDYDGMEREKAEADFRRRIEVYEQTYETIDPNRDRNMSYCKMINVGQQVITNKIEGYLQSRMVFYLMNLHLAPRSIFFTRHGESQFNVEGKIGGDSPLSERGAKYATALPKLVNDNIGDKPLTVWTSTLRRTIQTAQELDYPKLTWKALDELDAGVCDGMTYEEIEREFPEDYANRDEDKYNYRYRGGESYRDIVVRLEPIIIELERQTDILVVCHQAVLRCLYAYFHDLSQDELPYIKIPLHTVIKLTPKAYGCDEVRYALPIEAVDTTRPRPLKLLQNVPKVRDDGVSPSTRRPTPVPETIPVTHIGNEELSASASSDKKHDEKDTTATK